MRLPYLHATPREVRRPGVARTWFLQGFRTLSCPAWLPCCLCLGLCIALAPWGPGRNSSFGPRTLVVGAALRCPAVRGQAGGGATARFRAGCRGFSAPAGA